MKILKYIVIAIVGLIAIVAIIGFFSPRNVTLERSITINASSASIFEEINGYENFNNWSPWAKIDPENTTYTYEGADTGVGAKMSWTSTNSDVGEGSQEIMESIPNEKIRTEMFFGDFPDPNYANFLIVKEGESNRVTWTFEGDMGTSPIGKLMGRFMESMLGPSYEDGLQNLKELVEAKPTFSIQMGIEEVDPITYLAINTIFDLTKPETIGPTFGEVYGKIGTYMATNKIEAAGMPMSVTLEISDTEWNDNVAIPCNADAATPSGDIIVGTTMGGKTLKGIHLGDYNKLPESHAQMMAYMKYKSLEFSGDGYEVYETDPTNEPDTAKWQTILFYPLK